MQFAVGPKKRCNFPPKKGWETKNELTLETHFIFTLRRWLRRQKQNIVRHTYSVLPEDEIKIKKQLPPLLFQFTFKVTVELFSDMHRRKWGPDIKVSTFWSLSQNLLKPKALCHTEMETQYKVSHHCSPSAQTRRTDSKKKFNFQDLCLKLWTMFEREIKKNKYYWKWKKPMKYLALKFLLSDKYDL